MAGFLTFFLHYVDYNQLTINSIAVSLCLPFLLVNLPDANHFSRRAVPPPATDAGRRRAAARHLDQDGSGSLSYPELRRACRRRQRGH